MALYLVWHCYYYYYYYYYYHYHYHYYYYYHRRSNPILSMLFITIIFASSKNLQLVRPIKIDCTTDRVLSICRGSLHSNWFLTAPDCSTYSPHAEGLSTVTGS